MSESETVVKTSRFRIAPIWIVPIVAVILGLWLAINAYLDHGPSIVITFSDGGGIEEGKTQLKIEGIEIGVVSAVRLSEDLQGVTVTADLIPEARRMMRSDTEFWVVRPTISGLNVSGLGTILSGAYIAMSPGVGQISRGRSFVGLDRIPAAPAGTPGIRLKLTSESSGSANIGSPVLYRGFRVGAVESVDLDVNTQHVSYAIFIDAPYDKLVSTNTRFWDASGFKAELGADGINLDISSVQALLAGGISFDLPRIFSPGDPVKSHSAFRLYPSENSIHQNPHRYFAEYVVEFRQSLRGLHPGAPVTYRGIRIGSVEQILLYEMDVGAISAGAGPPIPVLIKLEPGRLDLGDTDAGVRQLNETVEVAISNGLRATLESGSLITGSLYVNLDFYDDAKVAELGTFKSYSSIPTTDSGLDHIMVQVSQLLDNLNDLPINKTLAELQSLMGTVRAILEDESTQDITGTLNKTLNELNRLIKGYSTDSEFNTELTRTLVEIKSTLNSVKGVADRLADQPNSIVFPGKPIEDPEPKAPH